MMMTTIKTIMRPLILLAIVPAVLVLTGCDREDHDDDHFLSVDRVEVRDRDTGDLYALWISGMDGFDVDAMPTLEVDEQLALDIQFFDFEGNEPHLGDEYLLDAWIDANAPADVVDLTVEDDHIIVIGRSVGNTSIVLDLAHGNHSDFTSVPLPIEVVTIPTGGNPNVP